MRYGACREHSTTQAGHLLGCWRHHGLLELGSLGKHQILLETVESIWHEHDVARKCAEAGDVLLRLRGRLHHRLLLDRVLVLLKLDGVNALLNELLL